MTTEMRLKALLEQIEKLTGSIENLTEAVVNLVEVDEDEEYEDEQND